MIGQTSSTAFVAAVVDIVSRRDLSIEVHHGNLPNKHKLALYKPAIHFNSSLKWLLYICNKKEHLSYKGGCSNMVLRHLKEELALATHYNF